MSRIGNMPISIPAGVTIEKTGNDLVVFGPKGSLTLQIPQEIKVEIEGNTVSLKRKNDQKKVKALHGLTRSLIANMVSGVQMGFSKNLELVGVGFRAQIDGNHGSSNHGSSNKLTLNVGFSHPVEVLAPQGVTFEIKDTTKIKVLGIDKQLVGQIAANIRKIKVPDVYKGKGIRYEGEYIRRKVGKAAKAGVVGVGGVKQI